eukprot:CAMPEP_0198311904 /NCGR_PEP_ID=MMETSP1450-20131203/3481_1 /TAXON_ID=753684 ORGANISM="Madagascaria erythrocladiodes, Strain CCMP3234" /NCGR_SAMPLE_ID=MMETSP1450 /ASSEMBLY_ACC=CAM_ASM_001115 /LENGTH=502 /DNA_ID=CAMNT_0044014823 /DNA_START=465 /DNA_END=1973 /DNA_ORIENTATION=+
MDAVPNDAFSAAVSPVDSPEPVDASDTAEDRRQRLQLAVEDLIRQNPGKQKGFSALRATARLHNVSKSTLNRHATQVAAGTPPDKISARRGRGTNATTRKKDGAVTPSPSANSMSYSPAVSPIQTRLPFPSSSTQSTPRQELLSPETSQPEGAGAGGTSLARKPSGRGRSSTEVLSQAMTLGASVVQFAGHSMSRSPVSDGFVHATPTEAFTRETSPCLGLENSPVTSQYQQSNAQTKPNAKSVANAVHGSRITKVQKGVPDGVQTILAKKRIKAPVMRPLQPTQSTENLIASGVLAEDQDERLRLAAKELVDENGGLDGGSARAVGLRRVARKYNVSRTTLQRRARDLANGLVTRRVSGRQPAVVGVTRPTSPSSAIESHSESVAEHEDGRRGGNLHIDGSSGEHVTKGHEGQNAEVGAKGEGGSQGAMYLDPPGSMVGRTKDAKDARVGHVYNDVSQFIDSDVLDAQQVVVTVQDILGGTAEATDKINSMIEVLRRYQHK